MKKFMVCVILLTGCVSNAQYSSLAQSFDAYIRETKPAYLKVDPAMPKSVQTAREHFVQDAEKARDEAFDLVGIAGVGS